MIKHPNLYARALAYVIIGFSVILSTLPAQAAFETRARAAYVLDETSGTVLLAKNADVPLPPASMSKLMTLDLAFEAIADGRLKLDEKLPVSKHAMSYKGSTMFLNTSDRVKVSDLLRGIIVLSGNDACVVIAEALSPDGTEAGFARMMTERARELGMKNSHFVNSNGWPDPGQRMSVHDLAILADHIIKTFPQFYPIFSETEFRFDGRASQNVRNRNPLLRLGIGAEGMKTGHTEEAGYGLVGTVKQGDRRVILVLSGLPTAGARASEGARIANWALRQFVEKIVAKKGRVLASAPVWNGEISSVGLSAPKDVKLLVPAREAGTLTATLRYKGPLKAPIKKGTKLAELTIERKDLPAVTVPLTAATDVAEWGFGGRMKRAASLAAQRLLTEAKGLF